jgi:hypothetical protein
VRGKGLKVIKLEGRAGEEKYLTIIMPAKHFNVILRGNINYQDSQSSKILRKPKDIAKSAREQASWNWANTQSAIEKKVVRAMPLSKFLDVGAAAASLKCSSSGLQPQHQAQNPDHSSESDNLNGKVWDGRQGFAHRLGNEFLSPRLLDCVQF